MVSLKDITQLRERTGCGIGDCKQALTESNGDIEKAIEYLRKKGQLKMADRAGRSTHEGVVEAYIHTNSKLGVLVALKSETDFVARTPDFRALAHEFTLQIAAARPQYVRREEVPSEVIAKEEEIYRAEAEATGKPAQAQAKMVEGKLAKFYETVCLTEQRYIKDEARTMSDLLAEAAQKFGEKIEVTTFARIEI